MCGIIAGVSYRNILRVLSSGLKKLEYRGYDSCGIATLENSKLTRYRTVSRVEMLEQEILKYPDLPGTIGIAHTRWATHGSPEIRNTHPHFSHDELAIVHNGIIENFEEIKQQLIQKGYIFESDTDTEVVVHLIHSFYQGNLFDAFCQAIPLLRGAYAIAVMSKDEPQKIMAARFGAPLVLGIGENENFVASDPVALSGVIEKFVYLENGDIAELTPQHYQVFQQDEHGFSPVDRPITKINVQENNVSLGNFTHYMEKEIYEQPLAVSNTIQTLAGFAPEAFGFKAPGFFNKLNRILIIACGTSYYSGLVAKYWIEKIAKVPCDVEIASEYRYRDSVPDPQCLVVAISQSGETADTLAALQHTKRQGMEMSLAICNVATSSMVKESEAHFITKAGTEIGVASTKAFTTQLVALYGLAVCIAETKHRLEQSKDSIIGELLKIPSLLDEVLKYRDVIQVWAQDFSDASNSIYLGRGMLFPVALEGALKLKEISYIHAEGYPSGELKHGPLALVDKTLPVLVIAPSNSLIEKVKSNIQEVKARKGKVYVFTDDESLLDNPAENFNVIKLPKVPEDLEPLVYTVPLQLLAYITATIKGTDVDKPRNLAKSVTVE